MRKMRKTVLAMLAVTVLLLVVVGPAMSDPNLFGHPVKWCTIKTPDTMTSIGVGGSLQLWTIDKQDPATTDDDTSIWLDGTGYYDGVTDILTIFGGLSTEADAVPWVGNIISLGGVFDRIGVGMSSASKRLMIYGTIDF